MSNRSVPVRIWLLLGCAVVGVSSAGAIFQHVDDVPPLLRASWRLQVTALLLSPFALMQWRDSSDQIRDKLTSKKTLNIIFLSGVFLAAHFGAWVASLDHTSLTHSLLFVTSHPIIIVGGMYVIHTIYRRIEAPKKGEVIGAFIGCAGAIITLTSQGAEQGDHTVTLFGDLLAFLGGVFVVGYIVCGKILRSWMPIFLYAFPVTLIAAILLLPCSFLLESQSVEFGIFGWLDQEYLPWFFLLASIAGFLGHTGLNTCLRYVSPLVISVAVTLEPVIGTIIGWMFFDTGIPDLYTIVGGIILLIGLMMVIIVQESTPPVETNNEMSDAGIIA